MNGEVWSMLILYWFIGHFYVYIPYLIFSSGVAALSGIMAVSLASAPAVLVLVMARACGGREALALGVAEVMMSPMDE